eukprot:SM005684S18747  [mRNA]  locus=s5684:272:977:+ [translate_table: standard]
MEDARRQPSEPPVSAMATAAAPALGGRQLLLYAAVAVPALLLLAAHLLAHPFFLGVLAGSALLLAAEALALLLLLEKVRATGAGAAQAASDLHTAGGGNAHLPPVMVQEGVLWVVPVPAEGREVELAGAWRRTTSASEDADGHHQN